ncbi:MAG: O-methyltransferase [Parachlamydiaceae bacterium]|nr:O-methyltransferase [Parachlamydiaceae bacterium]
MLESTNPRNQGLKRYIDHLFGHEDEILQKILENSIAKGLPNIQIPVHQGRFIQMLAKVHQVKRILELGTLGAYSTVWLARALPENGKLLSIESDTKHAIIARENIEMASLSHCVEVLMGNALDLLPKMVRQKEDPFDLIFIDADKENYKFYLDWCLKLCRKGSLILIDNLIPRGEQIGFPGNKEAKYVYAFNQYLANHPLLETSLIPTLVDEEGRVDGLSISQVV